MNRITRVPFAVLLVVSILAPSACSIDGSVSTVQFRFTRDFGAGIVFVAGTAQG